MLRVAMSARPAPTMATARTNGPRARRTARDRASRGADRPQPATISSSADGTATTRSRTKSAPDGIEEGRDHAEDGHDRDRHRAPAQLGDAAVARPQLGVDARPERARASR